MNCTTAAATARPYGVEPACLTWKHPAHLNKWRARAQWLSQASFTRAA